MEGGRERGRGQGAGLNAISHRDNGASRGAYRLEHGDGADREVCSHHTTCPRDTEGRLLTFSLSSPAELSFISEFETEQES